MTDRFLSPLPVHPASPHRFSWRNLLRHALQNIALNTLIAVVLWTSSWHNHFDVQWVYSQAIGLSIWLIIDGGRFVVDRNSPIGWPRGWRGLALVAFGIVVGCVLGTMMGDAYAHQSSLSRVFANGKSAASVFLITLVMGGVISYHYYVRGRSAYYQAELEVIKRQATEAQLKLLQTQLEPHMLFNTLANLRALIGTDPQRAQQMLDHMIAYLRATLSASRATMHTLQAEFDRLRDYLELMAVRMGPRLTYTLDLPADLAQHPVPTLLLQPLVENAIKHGLEPKVEGGSITVRARREGDRITLQVLDTGVGPPQGRAGVDGFGLAQVRERLTATYGNKGAIELIAGYASGTRASVTFPCET